MHLGCLVIARNYEVLDLAMSMEQTTAGSKDVHRSSVSTTGLGSGKSTKCDLTLTPGLYRNIAPTDPRVMCRSPSNRVIVAVHYILRWTARSRTHSGISTAKQVTWQKFVNPKRQNRNKHSSTRWLRIKPRMRYPLRTPFFLFYRLSPFWVHSSRLHWWPWHSNGNKHRVFFQCDFPLFRSVFGERKLNTYLTKLRTYTKTARGQTAKNSTGQLVAKSTAECYLETGETKRAAWQELFTPHLCKRWSGISRILTKG